MSATYLLRFDDLCPTMNWDTWEHIEEILLKHEIKPIVAVVPDNRDKILQVAPPKPDFWERVRKWQSYGWTIGMHGYQHHYVTKASGIIGMNNFSEFASLPFEEQENKIRKSMEIFKREGLNPTVWVAPGNSFDETTVAAVKKIGIRVVSDGFFHLPHRDDRGMMWVPHQIWKYRIRPYGVWTIGYHHNEWSPEDLVEFRRDIERHNKSITCLDEVVKKYKERRKAWFDSIFSKVYLRLIKFKNFARGLLP